jgi:hypothetical protein
MLCADCEVWLPGELGGKDLITIKNILTKEECWVLCVNYAGCNNAVHTNKDECKLRRSGEDEVYKLGNKTSKRACEPGTVSSPAFQHSDAVSIS